MPLSTEVGLGLGHIVLDEDPAPPQKGHSPNLAHIRCGPTAGWIKMPRNMEVVISPGDFVLDEDPAPPQKKGGHSTTIFGPCIVAKRLHASRCHFMRGRHRPRPHCVT